MKAYRQRSVEFGLFTPLDHKTRIDPLDLVFVFWELKWLFPLNIIAGVWVKVCIIKSFVITIGEVFVPGLESKLVKQPSSREEIIA